jgi:predicted RNA-binding protein
MMDEHSVITHATRGYVEKLADIREVTPRRMYEQLGDQCCYQKTKLLIRDIARVNQAGARLIKADLDALWLDVLEEVAEPSLEDIHREAFEAVDAILADRPAAIQETKLRELIEIAERKLEGIERKLRAV